MLPLLLTFALQEPPTTGGSALPISTVTGRVTELVQPAEGQDDLRFVLRGEGINVEVHVPASALRAARFSLKEGQTLTVTGPRRHAFVRDIVSARQLVRGRKRLILPEPPTEDPAVR